MALLFDSYLKRAKAFQERQEWKEALRAVQGALYILPSAKDAILCEFEILHKMEAWDSAARALRDALKYHPYWTWAILELADLMINRQQEATEAWRWLQRLKLCTSLSRTEYVRWRCLKVSALLEQERLFEAVRCLRCGLDRYPNDKDLLFLQGWVELQRDNYYVAASSLHRVLKQDPNNSDAHYYLAWAFRGLGEFRLMQEHYREAYELDLQDRRALRYDADLFHTMAQEAIDSCLEPGERASIRLVVLPLPPASILDEFPYDSRRMGVFCPRSDAPKTSSDAFLPLVGTLFLFQRNIERLCFNERDIRDEILHVANREMAAYSHWRNSSEFNVSDLEELGTLGAKA